MYYYVPQYTGRRNDESLETREETHFLEHVRDGGGLLIAIILLLIFCHFISGLRLIISLIPYICQNRNVALLITIGVVY